MRLLHIDTSIQGGASASRAMSAAAVERLRSGVPTLATTYRDLAAEPISHLTLDGFTSAEGLEALEQFLEADVVVLGVALYNFTISSQLKAWLDRILVAGRTFRYTERGPIGLVDDKRVIVTLARGGVYSEGPMAAMEHAETLLRGILTFIGVTEPEFVIAEGLALGEEARRVGIARAIEEAGRLAPLRPSVG